jgi:methionine-gamma-lyase
MKKMKPESLMMSHGYKPELSEEAIKPPVFLTSTFAFKTAEAGKAFFQTAYGLRNRDPEEEEGLIYSRINNPNLEIFEDRLCLWDEAADAAVFESGMAAITTVLLEFLKPGDLLVYSSPLYGGTMHFISHVLPKFGIHSLAFFPGEENTTLQQKILDSGMAEQLAMIYVETPANPTNTLIDIEACKMVANHFEHSEHRVYLAVDNTYMGPLWQHPLKHGADFSLYSATKYIGGHSDIIAGACCGTEEVMPRVKGLRTLLGNMASPHTAWMLTRSLETLSLRMKKQTENAQKIVAWLVAHPAVSKVYYPGLIKPESRAWPIYQKQLEAPGAMVSFDIVGGEPAAYCFLNSLKLIKLAVSLGSTESLAEHPATMTHVSAPIAYLDQVGITENLVRISVGVEDADDLIADFDRALNNCMKL